MYDRNAIFNWQHFKAIPKPYWYDSCICPFSVFRDMAYCQGFTKKNENDNNDNSVGIMGKHSQYVQIYTRTAINDQSEADGVDTQRARQGLRHSM